MIGLVWNGMMSFGGGWFFLAASEAISVLNRGCNCRKPHTGMYLEFANQHNIDLDGIPAVGDSLRDIQAAQSVGAEAILVKTGNGLTTLKRNPELDVPTFVNLHEAVQYILFTQS